jgi:hypothetical protein
MKQGDIFSYLDMCQHEKTTLQRGMNYSQNGKNILLMSLRENAPYADRVEEDGRVLIYEGHDIQKNHTKMNPKTVDQPEKNPSGTKTQNGLFHQAAQNAKNGQKPELVKVYEKLRDGIWTYNGIFELIDSWKEKDLNNRFVFKFKLSITENYEEDEINVELEHTRLIPSEVKRQVWIRDKGQCTQCGSKDNLHFDHIIPFSKGGSSLVAENIQLLCARHNLNKRDKIE